MALCATFSQVSGHLPSMRLIPGPKRLNLPSWHPKKLVYTRVDTDVDTNEVDVPLGSNGILKLSQN